MKKLISVIVVILSAGTCNLIYEEQVAPTEGIRIYDEDYIKNMKVHLM